MGHTGLRRSKLYSDVYRTFLAGWLGFRGFQMFTPKNPESQTLNPTPMRALRALWGF